MNDKNRVFIFFISLIFIFSFVLYHKVTVAYYSGKATKYFNQYQGEKLRNWELQHKWERTRVKNYNLEEIIRELKK